MLYCENNQLTTLNNLPNTLTSLYCSNNQLIKLSNLPNSLTGLYCSNNKLLFTEFSELKKLDNFIQFFNLNKLLKVIFLYSVKKRCLKYKEELIIKTCHPLRLFFI